MLSSIIIVAVVILFLTTVPVWSYSRNWGYSPISWSALALAILFLMLLFGRL